MKFLDNYSYNSIPLNIVVEGLIPKYLFLGRGNQPLEIVVFESKIKPKESLIQKAFKVRKSGRATPILVIVNSPDGNHLCGTYGERNWKSIWTFG